MFRNLICAFFLLCGVSGARAITLLAPPSVETTPAGDAVVRWKIDSAAGGKVHCGIAEGKYDQTVSDGVVGTEHAVTLHGLQPGTRYFYSVGTARVPLATGSFVAGKPGTAATQTPAEKPSLLKKIERAILKPSETKPIPAKPIVHDAPATRLTWGNIGSLPDHFARHGGDFSAKSQDDYAAQAWRFRERAVAERLPMKLDTDGTVRVFDPKTRAFAAFNRDGTTKTYFRPDSTSYWQRQPGRLILTPPWVSQ